MRESNQNHTEQQLHQLELTVAEAKRSMELALALDRLRANKDFELVIGKGYFEQEAARLVLMKAEPSLQSGDNQKSLDNGIIAVGHLRQYFNKIYQFGQMAERAIEEANITREELLAESLMDEEA